MSGDNTSEVRCQVLACQGLTYQVKAWQLASKQHPSRAKQNWRHGQRTMFDH